jgi:hypothetical protein
MISTTTSIVQNQLFIKKCNKAFEAINDDIEDIQSDVDELKKNDEKIFKLISIDCNVCIYQLYGSTRQCRE